MMNFVQQGLTAYQNGVHFNNNPFDWDTHENEAFDWFLGWMDGHLLDRPCQTGLRTEFAEYNNLTKEWVRF